MNTTLTDIFENILPATFGHGLIITMFPMNGFLRFSIQETARTNTLCIHLLKLMVKMPPRLLTA